jgi:hypothetical protein
MTPKLVAKTTEEASLPELLNRLELALPEILDRAPVDKALVDLTNRPVRLMGSVPHERAEPRLRDVGTRSSSNPSRCFLERSLRPESFAIRKLFADHRSERNSAQNARRGATYPP